MPDIITLDGSQSLAEMLTAINAALVAANETIAAQAAQITALESYAETNDTNLTAIQADQLTQNGRLDVLEAV